MSYRATESSCTLSPEERVEEAQRILTMVDEFQDMMTPNERDFVEKMDGAPVCSIKQLFYLRDIKDRYI